MEGVGKWLEVEKGGKVEKEKETYCSIYQVSRVRRRQYARQHVPFSKWII